MKLARGWRILLGILGVLVGIWVICLVLNLLPFAPGAYQGRNAMRIQAGDPVHIVPHGGAKDLFPENTVLSFREMYERGWNTFEIDLVLTQDDVLVTHHDLGILATTGQDIPLRDLSYDDLLEYNFGVNFVDPSGEQPYRNMEPNLAARLLPLLVPARLDQLLAEYPDARYILELKDTEAASGKERSQRAVEVFLKTVRDSGIEDQIVLASFDSGVTGRFRELSGGQIATGAGTFETLIFSVLSAVGLDFFLPTPYSSVMLPVKDRIREAERSIIEKLPAGLRNALTSYDSETDTMYTNLVNQRMVDDAHRKNLAVFYWTVNDARTMNELIDLGVDGIITDRPDILSQVLAERGY